MRRSRPSSLAAPGALLVLVAACAPITPPRGMPPGKATPARPGWRPVPATADGQPVAGGWHHRIKRGETGLSIANAYRVPWSRIAAANNIDRNATLYVGQVLFIPSSPPAARPAPPRTASRPATRPRPAPDKSDDLSVDDAISASSPAVSRPPTPAPAAPPPAPATTASIPALSWPVDGRVILSHFGPKASGRVNDGINIKAPDGATVRAAAAGEVIYVGGAVSGFGLMLLLRHPGGVVTAYGHLKDAIASRGNKVQRGQPIAHVGTSGKVSEPQLHFQLRSGRKALDPLRYLPR